MKKLEIWPGVPYPRGATWDGKGTNFSLFSENAQRVELNLFDSTDDSRLVSKINITEKTVETWHCYIPGIEPGQKYAYRVFGKYDPIHGHRFNGNKLLLDPYAKTISGVYRWDDSLFGYKIGDMKNDLSKDRRDSSKYTPKCVVTNQEFDWEDDKMPRHPWNETVIYEAHVKGLTALHPLLPPKIKGTYEGLGSPTIIDYLSKLGVTAVELLPIQQHLDDRYLREKGLVNYWGYSTIGFFAPDSRYSSSGSDGQQVIEFKRMVKNLHAAGIEVIMDVVYNHTAEGNEMGPTLCFRGIDNAAYYNLSPEDPRYYMDFSGCGSSFNMRHPRVLQFIMDSLRYWVNEMHVDGFRFDLASTLAREFFEVDKLSSFFDIILQDPILSQVKLIAEPWDLGPGGYQVGKFPGLWTEWNGKYRDTLRRFWKGDEGQLPEFGSRITGSSDLYQNDGRKPCASINFITCHDGFTLSDLVSYNEKHNENNGEENRDGADDNYSWNCGEEGISNIEEIKSLRLKQRQNFILSLFLSQGTPMLLAGDECGRTQGGNNNAYCQDNEITWMDWHLNEEELNFLNFTRECISLRRNHPVFRRKLFLQGKFLHKDNVKDIHWFNTSGGEMSEQDWNNSIGKAIALYLSGNGITDIDRFGNRIFDDSFFLLFNASHEPVNFVIPELITQPLHVLINTAENLFDPNLKKSLAVTPLEVAPRSMMLLTHEKSSGE